MSNNNLKIVTLETLAALKFLDVLISIKYKKVIFLRSSMCKDFV